MLPLVRGATRTVGRRRWLLPKHKPKKSTSQIQQEIENQTKRERLILESESRISGIQPQQQGAIIQALIRERPISNRIMEEQHAIPKATSTMSNHEWMMYANEQYRSTFATQVGSLPIIPARHMTIITCMDARIDPGKAMGIAEGDCHIIRNAGGRVKDALRSLIISQEMMGTREVAIIHHTNCGACTLNENNLRQRLLARAQPSDASDIDFMSFNNADVFENVRNEIKVYQSYQTLIQGIPVKGYVFDVKTGSLHHVHENAHIDQEIACVTSQQRQQTPAATTATTASPKLSTTIPKTLVEAQQQQEHKEQKQSNISSPSSSAAAAATATAAAIGMITLEQQQESAEKPVLTGEGSLQRLVRLVSSSFSA